MEIIRDEKRHAVRKSPSSHCPFIHTFSPSCYCTEMKSTRIEDAIYYCGGDYQKCNIYNNLKTKNDSSLVLDLLQKEDLI